MTQALIRGSTQILDGSINAAKFAASLGLATSQLADGANFLKRDGSVTWTADHNAGGFKLTNLATPTNPGDAAPKSYVDAVVNGLDPKPGVDVVAVANIASLTGTPTVDGVTLVAGDTILLTAQTTASQNGIWVIAAGAWTRPAWWTGASTVTEGSYVPVQRGTQYAGSSWIVTTQSAITVDTTSVAFQQFTAPGGSVTAGNGINVTGNQVSVKNGNGITFDGSQNVTLVLNGSSLNLGASGIKISDSASPGQVMIGNGSNAAAFTTFSGDISAITGAGAVTLTSTIRRTSSFVYNEVPTGTINGVNATFTLASTPVAGTPQVFLNGVLQFPGAGNDYTISSGTITMLNIPQTGDRLTVSYQV